MNSCILGKKVGVSPKTADDLHRMAAAAFHKRNIAVIPLDKLTNEIDLIHVVQIAERLYGQRKEKSYD